jgi:hypothetical protein
MRSETTDGSTDRTPPVRELGFDQLWEQNGYAGFGSGQAQFILQDLDQPAFASNLMIKIDMPDLDAWWIELTAKNLSDRFPGVRLKPPTDYPWGREVHLIDLAGVCWHFGLP